MNSLRFDKPRKEERRLYIHGSPVERYSHTGDERDGRYYITRDLKAYYLSHRDCVALASELSHAAVLVGHVERGPVEPGDQHKTRARWATPPRVQRAYTKLYRLCRQDWGARSHVVEKEKAS